MEKTFTDYRKLIYASINSTKSSLVHLKSSKLLSKNEKDKLTKVIEAMEELRVEFYNNRGSKKTES